MPRKRFKTEEIIQKLREAEVLLSQGRNVAEAELVAVKVGRSGSD